MSDPGDPPPLDPTIEWDGDPAAGDPASGAAKPPWYRRPAPLAVAVLTALLVVVLGAALLVSGDDNGGPSVVNILRIERTDEFGNPLARDLVADIDGEAGAEDFFVWLAPPNAEAPLPAVTVTDAASGRAEFQWAPTDLAADPETWVSDIVFFEGLRSDESLSAADFDCTYARHGEPEGRAVLRVSYDDAGDLRAPRTAVYRFLGYRFAPGDVTTCVIASGPGAAGTGSTTGASAESSTTIPSGSPTDTTPPTDTAPPTDTTTPSETTTPPTDAGTTLPGTTQPGTTAPPAATTSVMTVIDGRADLSQLRDLIDFAGLRDTFADPAAVLTVFAPTNEAFIDYGLDLDFLEEEDQPFVRDILLTHLHRGDALVSSALLALTEIDVEFGGPQEIDGESVPPTIGFADIIEFDAIADNGVLHVLSDVLDPELE